MTTASWSEGYFTGAGYTHGYFYDLNPRLATYVMLLEGLEGPPPGPCCELGFGQGLTLAMQAAGDPTRPWWGCDFMPEHAVQARRLVDAAGVHAEIGDESFEEFFARPDLPRFAFIALHGVWSWVSQANRARIVAFLQRHLLPGGVVYVSYNSLAGWAAMQPLRDLMHQHMRHVTGSGMPTARKVQEAMAFLQQLRASKPALLVECPGVDSMLRQLDTKPAEYLLHEFMSDDWLLSTPAQVAAELHAAKLTRVASSDLLQRVKSVNLTPAHQALLEGIDDPGLRESTHDVLTATSFRREFWVRGPSRLSSPEAARRMQAQRVVLAAHPDAVSSRLEGRQGTHQFPEAHMSLLMEALQQADAPLPIGTLMHRAAAAGVNPNALVETLSFLLGKRFLMLAHSDDEVAAARPATQRLNTYLLGPHSQRGRILYLASPVTGCGVPATALLQLFLAAREAAPQEPERWPTMVWAVMQAEGQQLVNKDGAPVTTRAEAQAALQPMVESVLGQALPRLLRLGVVPRADPPG